MHFIQTVLVGCALLLTLSFGSMKADLGPAELRFFGKGGDSYLFNRRSIRSNPLCYAIANKKMLSMTIETVRKVDRKIIISSKRITIEPYVFGYASGGQSLLSGNIVEERPYGERVLEVGDRQYEEYAASPVKNPVEPPSYEDSQKQAYLAQFEALKTKFQKVEVRQVSNIGVLVDASFNGPLVPGTLHTPDMRVVVCSIKISS